MHGVPNNFKAVSLVSFDLPDICIRKRNQTDVFSMFLIFVIVQKISKQNEYSRAELIITLGLAEKSSFSLIHFSVPEVLEQLVLLSASILLFFLF